MTSATRTLSEDLRMIVTYNPISIDEDTPLSILLEQVYSSGIHRWPVVDKKHQVIGVVSDTDVVNAGMACLSMDSGLKTTEPVCTFMSNHVLTVDQDVSSLVALRLMVENQVNLLPVVQNNKLQAMVTTTDFIRDYYLTNQNGNTEKIALHLDQTPVQADASMTLL
ncbi:MAG: CBS domain-containing protein [Pirellulales bacterium]